MTSTLEQLQRVLQQDEVNQRKEASDRKSRRSSMTPLQGQIDHVLRAHGVLSPTTGSWVRPIPSSLYCSPLSSAQSTMMFWSSLPHSIRSRLKPPLDQVGADAVVEVPLALLAAEEVEGASGVASNPRNRPLGGNLTNKLKEYTRGAAGQCKPFRPGGMDNDVIEDDNAHEIANEEYRSPEEILLARQVLENGSTAGWKDGTIITSPPGAQFEIGLGWNDLCPNEAIVSKGMDTSEVSPVGVDTAVGSQDHPESTIVFGEFPLEHNTFRKGGGMWERGFLEDDDSLFVESSSDSEEETTDEDEEEPTMEIGDQKHSPKASDEQNSTQTQNDDAVATDADEVDYLLAELSLSTWGSGTKPKRMPNLGNNPLKLAEIHAKEQQESTRKSWADSKLLPIRDFHSLIPNPAMTFPFELDAFQQQAIARLERSESIFVAAHTSAGKTVCAEYAVAMCKQHCTRLVYTSPIKALSNQKFRDFCTKFGTDNVGLVTGDLQINVDDATCLIMTTEILRSMLYRGADLIRDIEWVCFDEVHYVNDSERGVVWEEVIIMLPIQVNMMFLSATSQNTIEFSDWIGKTKRKPVHVIRTNYRPVPLCHSLWAGLKLHTVMEGKGSFLEKGYAEASKALLPASANDKKSKSKGTVQPARRTTGSKQLAWQAQGNKQNWTSLVKYLDREGLTPTVVFSFSKKKCEEIAHMLRSLDLNTAAEKSAAHAFTIQTIARLSPSDSSLPQVLTICEMVKRGIGVHHGGLLPILKEMIEILFSRNLIKVLFATETFAMGVNMPARAVVFNSIRKHDGAQFRVLEPGEYTQMAGRAGRRGLDKIGTVIICCFGETPPPQPILRNMLTGSSTRLQSQFRLTYNMILNLLRVDDMSVEDMIKRSFSEFATQRALTAKEYPKLLVRGMKILSKLDKQFSENAESRIGAEDLEEYFSACSNLLNLNRELLSFMLNFSSHALSPGRVLLVTAARKHGFVKAPALVLRPPVSASASSAGLRSYSNGETSRQRPMVCIVLLPEGFLPQADGEGKLSDLNPKPFSVGYVGFSHHRYFAIREIELDEVFLVTAIKHKIVGKDMLKNDLSSQGVQTTLMDPFAGAAPAGRNNADDFAGMVPRGKKDQAENSTQGSSSSQTAKEQQQLDQSVSFLIDAEAKEFSSKLQALDMKDLVKQGSDIVAFRERCSQVEELVGLVRSFSSHRHPSIEQHYAGAERKEALRNRVEVLRHILSNESLQLFPDFLQRKAVLRSLGYVDENDTVCVKGKVACEVNTCEELIVTEMVFEGVLNELEPAEIVAALSALVFQEKSHDDTLDVELPEHLSSCCECMKAIAVNLGQIQKQQGLEIDPSDYCDNSLKFGLVHVVYEWALGVPFSNICQLTLVQEGSIVRCITRLDELCREVRNCARVVGNPTLYRKMESASVIIKRDIVFASSLYVS